MANPNTTTENGTETKKGPGRPAGPKADKPAKAALMAAFAKDYGQIQIARAALAELEEKASQSAAEIVKHYEKGPHKMGDNKIVSFQKVAHQVRHTVLDLANVE